jgi:hypothetical protein
MSRKWQNSKNFPWDLHMMINKACKAQTIKTVFDRC